MKTKIVKKRKTKKMKGGFVDPLSMVVGSGLALSAAYGINNVGFIALTSFLGSVQSDTSLLNETMIISLNLAAQAYYVYNQGGVDQYFRTPMARIMHTLMGSDVLRQDFKRVFSSIFVTVLDLLFIYDLPKGTVLPKIDASVSHCEMQLSEGATLHKPNNVIFCLIDLLIFALENMPNRNSTVPLDKTGNTDKSVETRASATWRIVCGKFVANMQDVNRDSELYTVLSFLSMYFFTPEMPSVVKIMLEHAYLYNHSGILDDFYGYKGILKALHRIKILLTHDTTVRLDILRPFLRGILLMVEGNSIFELPTWMESTSFNSFAWHFTQTLIANTNELIKYKTNAEECGINERDLRCLINEINFVTTHLYLSESNTANRLMYPAARIINKACVSMGVLFKIQSWKNRLFGKEASQITAEALSAAPAAPAAPAAAAAAAPAAPAESAAPAAPAAAAPAAPAAAHQRSWFTFRGGGDPQTEKLNKLVNIATNALSLALENNMRLLEESKVVDGKVVFSPKMFEHENTMAALTAVTVETILSADPETDVFFDAEDSHPDFESGLEKIEALDLKVNNDLNGITDAEGDTFYDTGGKRKTKHKKRIRKTKRKRGFMI